MNLIEFNQKITENPIPLVVDFWAPWCGPCKAMEPFLNDVSKQFSGKVELLKLNVDDNPEIAKALGIMSIPTSMGYISGKQVYRKIGFQNKAGLIKVFNDLSEGKTTVTNSISSLDRILRLGIGAVLIYFGTFRGLSIWLLLLGAIVAFTAIYDRCPIYKALSEKVKRLFANKNRSSI